MYSVTITGIIVTVLSQVLGDSVSQGDIATFLNVGGLLFGALIAWFGRYRQGDITWFGAKK